MTIEQLSSKPIQRSSHSIAVKAAMKRAASLIAPTWPLDQFIAVNPFWQRTDKPLAAVSAELTALSGTRLLMPRLWYREQIQSGTLTRDHLQRALQEHQSAMTVDELLEHLYAPERPVAQRARVMDIGEYRPNVMHDLSWREFITHRLSQFCAAYFDDGQGQYAISRDGGLYAAWRRHAVNDKSASLLMGVREFSQWVFSLPTDAVAMAEHAVETLQISSSQIEQYFAGLLLDINGWSAWCAYQRWVANHRGQEDDHTEQLLAIMLAWETLVFRSQNQHFAARWHRAMAQWAAIDAAARAAQQRDWIFQTAIELAWQREAIAQFPAALKEPQKAERPEVQAVFCIDVRSEVFRRALEAQSSTIQTLGFAGFFGLPIEYQPAGAVTARPHLPGLIAPKLRVTEAHATPAEIANDNSQHTSHRAWKTLKTHPLSAFSFVESLGLSFASRLLQETVGLRSFTAPQGVEISNQLRNPRITHFADGRVIDDTRISLAHGVLKAMSLTERFAPLVVLVGHGSATHNNAHAAGLDCGACGGQTGEVNARAAAALLNDPVVRKGLKAKGVHLPEDTRFIAALHNTCTDEVEMFDLNELLTQQRESLLRFASFIERAALSARRERAEALGLQSLNDASLWALMKARSRDWAQVRPEWGLVNNAALVVAPREHSRSINFKGRAFLHEYRASQDPDFSTLELLMTAPMVVAHWINFQYYASTVDPKRYGSGDKVLHNVVGGHVGVFEGNGGDLRIGLPLQSVHDGERWFHTPLRLSVFIEAPRAAIERVLQKHGKVRELVENQWLHLFQLDAQQHTVHAYREQRWVSVNSLGDAPV